MADTVMGTGTGTGTLEIQIGSTLGSYEIVGLLGKGAMGRVYRARHARLGREVALKVLNPEFIARPDVVQRFFREARVVNDIDHENIVEVSDFVEQPGVAYLVMELLDGVTLHELLGQSGRRYPQIKRIVAILRQVCDALGAAHAKGVIHRDLKPDNVFVVKRDGADFAKVLDFGVAKLRGGGDLAETTTGMIIGTPHYMAPEQALGRDITRATDVWAAGVVLYEALAGAVPFKGESFVELANQIRMQPPAPLPAKTPRGEKIPAWLGEVIAKCLEKKPGDRFKSMAALGEALDAGGPLRSEAFPRRLVGVAAAVALAGAGIGVAWHYDVPGRARLTYDKARRGWQTLGAQPPEPVGPPASRETKPLAPAAVGSPPATPATTGAKHATAPAEAPASQPAPEPAVTKPRAALPAAPKRPATVELAVRTSPTGARVTRLDTGERLGRTPVRLNVPRKAATVWIQVALDGYQPIKFAVDLRKDNSANITFQGAKRTTRRR
jgi:serine/threonine-protein kinase